MNFLYSVMNIVAPLVVILEALDNDMHVNVFVINMNQLITDLVLVWIGLRSGFKVTTRERCIEKSTKKKILRTATDTGVYYTSEQLLLQSSLSFMFTLFANQAK